MNCYVNVNIICNKFKSHNCHMILALKVHLNDSNKISYKDNRNSYKALQNDHNGSSQRDVLSYHNP